MFSSKTVLRSILAFPACSGTMGIRTLRKGEQLWYDQIRVNFMYPRAKLFTTPLTTTEGAGFLNPRPCGDMTLAREEVVILSIEESIASSDQELSFPPYACVGVLRNLGVDTEGQAPKKAPKKKTASIVGGPKAKKLEASATVSDAASCIGGKFKAGGIDGTRSSGSVTSKEQKSSAIPTSAPADEERATDHMAGMTRKKSSKNEREEPRPNPMPAAKKVAFQRPPVIGKKGNLGSLMSKLSPESRAVQPKIRIIHSKSTPQLPPPADGTKKVKVTPTTSDEKVTEKEVEVITSIDALIVKGTTLSSELVKFAENIERVEKTIEIEADEPVEEADKKMMTWSMRVIGPTCNKLLEPALVLRRLVLLARNIKNLLSSSLRIRPGTTTIVLMTIAGGRGACSSLEVETKRYF